MNNVKIFIACVILAGLILPQVCLCENEKYFNYYIYLESGNNIIDEGPNDPEDPIDLPPFAETL